MARTPPHVTAALLRNGHDAEAGLQERQAARIEDTVVAGRLALSDWLIGTLDGATRTGRLPPQAQLAPHVAAWDMPEYLSSGWDGTVEGVPVDDPLPLRWCTLRQWYGWGFPCGETLDAIASACRQSGALIDLGAGTGYWTAVLRAMGIDAMAVDTDRRPQRWSAKWADIRHEDGIGTARRMPGVPVLVSWPDPRLDATRLVAAMEPGRLLLRCGPRDRTCKALSERLDTCFAATGTAPVMKASGGIGDRLEILTRLQGCSKAR